VIGADKRVGGGHRVGEPAPAGVERSVTAADVAIFGQRGNLCRGRRTAILAAGETSP
jgi:hypothetical protein